MFPRDNFQNRSVVDGRTESQAGNSQTFREPVDGALCQVGVTKSERFTPQSGTRVCHLRNSLTHIATAAVTIRMLRKTLFSSNRWHSKRTEGQLRRS